MDKFLFFNIVITILNIFLIVYAYSLNFFPKKWRKKVNQDTIVGLALIFLTMFTGFLWVFYYYYKLIYWSHILHSGKVFLWNKRVSH